MIDRKPFLIFRWVLVAVLALGGVLVFAAGAAMGQGDETVKVTPMEACSVEKQLLARENAALRAELIEANGLKLLSQLYQSHGLSQATHEFNAATMQFVKKPEKIAKTPASESGQ